MYDFKVRHFLCATSACFTAMVLSQLHSRLTPFVPFHDQTCYNVHYGFERSLIAGLLRDARTAW